MDETFFPGIQEFTEKQQEAIKEVNRSLGLEIKLRCCMPEFATASICGWRHRPIRASIQGTLPGLSADVTKNVFNAALRAWNSVCNAGLEWTDDWNKANIKSSIGKIDGRSGTLAWSYLISCGGNSTINTQLTQLYDSSEGWTYDWALEVMEHELGHALGLPHDSHTGALMYPYSHAGKVLLPTQYEIAKVLPLYGNPVNMPPGAVPVIAGGTLVMSDGTVVGVDGTSRFSFGGKTYTLKVQ